MARPRKRSGEPDAQQRLVDALWLLLESNRLNDLTVGMVTAKAGCNRGTLYYHHADLDALVYSAIERELVGDGSVISAVYDLVLGTGTASPTALMDTPSFRRLGLAIEQGGIELVSAKIKDIVARMWQAALRPEGVPLQPATHMLLEYHISGVVALLARHTRSRAHGGLPQDDVSELLRRAASFLIDALGDAEGVSPEEALARLQTASRVSRAMLP
ncbi:hypothetical protein BN3658_00586 [Coriobacteriaceae bacterium CHKCI002]|uniref:TetR/AcrR family transcriptional regulator n=1 Tax=Rubneribacter badeniensis TaxID=2070688 RepID=A0A9D2VL98_9ACTN|nr:hypothetical protein B5F41_10095 [Gordonibacter sp. An232A]CVH76126.1 hypothetical protein BN3658_00586 [Coriobacteriaceae bacterium CHKCI002]HJH43763.1 TetR/AcrR family transcriptional regulator [Rubneribacter badeniensis]